MRSLLASSFVVGCSLVVCVAAAQSSVNGPMNVSPGAARAAMPASMSPRTAALSTPSQLPRVAPRSFVRPPAVTRPTADAAMNHSSYAPGYFGGSSARATLSQVPRRAPIQSAPPQLMRAPSKPFETIHHEPTISPYLNLYRNEDNNEGAPNYHTFVRPYQEQIETNRVQQREIQRLRGQLQGISSTIATPQYGEAALPVTGTRSRYMDTAQFYGGWRR
jgi:hypothetical protein